VSVERLTLDTMVVRDYMEDRDPYLAAVQRLIELAAIGEVDLAVTRHIRDDVPGGTLAERLNELPDLGVQQTAGVVIIGESTFDGGDVFGDHRVTELQQRLERDRQPGMPQLPGELDWRHLHAHLVQHRDVFLTRDGPILRLSAELRAIGMTVMSPT
jgi:hypothetical protein